MTTSTMTTTTPTAMITHNESMTTTQIDNTSDTMTLAAALQGTRGGRCQEQVDTVPREVHIMGQTILYGVYLYQIFLDFGSNFLSLLVSFQPSAWL